MLLRARKLNNKIGMQLNIIIDKSLFQSLSPKALTALDRHFQVAIPPILIKEIIGDLSATRKIKDREIDMESFVANLADRFGVSSIVCLHYLPLIQESLLGVEIPMDGRIVAGGMTPVSTTDGKGGSKILPTQEDRDLQRWQEHRFNMEEAIWANRWQKIRKFINTNLYLDELNKAGVTVTKPKSLEQLQKTVDDIFSNSKAQSRLLSLIGKEFPVTYEIHRRAVTRWSQSKRPLLKDFAPYAAHCLKANLLLAIGNMNEHILGEQDAHDLRDLEYCYYLPFCEVFASLDKIHRKLIQLLMRPNQDFVGIDLKNDLERLGSEWFLLSEKEKIERHHSFGFRPAPDKDSIVRQLWERHRPDYDPGKAIVPKHGGELHQFFKGLFDQLNQAHPTEGIVKEDSFVIRERTLPRKKLAELYPGIDFDAT